MTEDFSFTEPEKMNYHTLKCVLTFILLPPFWFLSIPALIFSHEARKLDAEGLSPIASRFCGHADRYSNASWLLFLILLISVSVLAIFSFLNLI